VNSILQRLEQIADNERRLNIEGYRHEHKPNERSPGFPEFMKSTEKQEEENFLSRAQVANRVRKKSPHRTERLLKQTLV
jgi:hypothetical protein